MRAPRYARPYGVGNPSYPGANWDPVSGGHTGRPYTETV